MRDIPEALFEERDDVDRLMYLYSEKTSICEDTISFWRRSIESYCLINRTLIFKSAQIAEAFIRHDLIPTSAAPSVSILANRKEVLEVATVNSAISSSLLENVKNTAFGWAVSVFTSIMKVNAVVEKELVLSSLLKSIADYTGKSLAGKPDKDCVVFCSSRDALDEGDTFAGLMKTVSESITPFNGHLAALVSGLEDMEMSLLQNYLVATGYAVRSADAKIIQILRSDSRGSTNASNKNKNSNSVKGVFSISEVEVARLKLKNSIAMLEKRVSDLEGKMDAYRSKAVQYKSKGNERMALVQLKLRKSVTQSRDRLSSALINLIQAFEQMDDMEFNIAIKDAYVTATSGLRSARNTYDISPESVDDAIDAFNEEMDHQQEIDSALADASSSSLGGGAGADEELESELEALMNDMSISAVTAPSRPLINHVEAVEVAKLGYGSGREGTVAGQTTATATTGTSPGGRLSSAGVLPSQQQVKGLSSPSSSSTAAFEAIHRGSQDNNSRGAGMSPKRSATTAAASSSSGISPIRRSATAAAASSSGISPIRRSAAGISPKKMTTSAAAGLSPKRSATTTSTASTTAAAATTTRPVFVTRAIDRPLTTSSSGTLTSSGKGSATVSSGTMTGNLSPPPPRAISPKPITGRGCTSVSPKRSGISASSTSSSSAAAAAEGAGQQSSLLPRSTVSFSSSVQQQRVLTPTRSKVPQNPLI